MKTMLRISAGVVFGFLMSIAILFIVAWVSGPVDIAATKSITQSQQRKEKIECQFSSWDGSHKNLTQIIKNAMNDPGSYEHVETVYWDLKTHLVILTTYRGKNLFGGVVPNWVKAKADLDGNVIEIIEMS